MIDKLEMLLALSREGHFRHAAHACGVSQPALSIAIKQLEDAFGMQLVQRGNRFKGFTPEGEKVLEWARRIVGDARTMYQELEALKHGICGEIRIGVIPTALPVVARLTNPYRANFPKVSFTVLSKSSNEILTEIHNLDLDAGLTYLDNEPLGGLLSVPLYNEEYRLLVSSDSPFAKRKTITWAELGKTPLCLLTSDTQNRRIIDRLLHGAKAKVVPMLETNSPIVLYSHVATGDWATITPQMPVDTMRFAKEVKEISIINPAVKYSIGLVARKHEVLTPAIKALLRDAKRLFSKQS